MKDIYNFSKYILALIVGKSLIVTLKLFKRRGTALPGLVTEKISKDFLKYPMNIFSNRILITGTNGKTSTQTVLSSLLPKIVVNSRGANLERGLIAQLLRSLSIWELLTLRSNRYENLVFEVEEATLPKIINKINPHTLIVTNFFRDQLDAYGEIDRTKQHIIHAIEKSNLENLVINGDDPQCLDVISKGKDYVHKTTLVKVGDALSHISYEDSGKSIIEEEKEQDFDNKNDSIDTLDAIDTFDNSNTFDTIDYNENDDIDQDTDHHSAQSSKKIRVINFPTAEISSDSLGVNFSWKNKKISANLPGYYSYYAFAFSFTILELMGIGFTNEIAKKANAISPAFGRGERLTIGNNFVQLFLVKNPVGFDLALDLLKNLLIEFILVIMVNDKIADGRDVSWLWDSKLEKLNSIPNISHIYIGGERAEDMALRVKYTDFDMKKVTLEKDTQKLIKILKNQPQKQIKYIGTYTAMNEFRDQLI